jgi:hypothetical protein
VSGQADVSSIFEELFGGFENRTSRKTDVGEIATSRKTDVGEIATSRKTGRARGYIAAYQPQARTRVLLDDAAAVLNEYREYWPLTIRQIFYRLVGTKDYPKTETF